MLSQQSKEALRVLGVEKRAEELYKSPLMEVFMLYHHIAKLFDPNLTSLEVFNIAALYYIPEITLLKIAIRINRQLAVRNV